MYWHKSRGPENKNQRLPVAVLTSVELSMQRGREGSEATDRLVAKHRLNDTTVKSIAPTAYERNMWGESAVLTGGSDSQVPINYENAIFLAKKYGLGAYELKKAGRKLYESSLNEGKSRSARDRIAEESGLTENDVRKIAIHLFNHLASEIWDEIIETEKNGREDKSSSRDAISKLRERARQIAKEFDLSSEEVREGEGSELIKKMHDPNFITREESNERFKEHQRGMEAWRSETEAARKTEHDLFEARLKRTMEYGSLSHDRLLGIIKDSGSSMKSMGIADAKEELHTWIELIKMRENYTNFQTRLVILQLSPGSEELHFTAVWVYRYSLTMGDGVAPRVAHDFQLNEREKHSAALGAFEDSLKIGFDINYSLQMAHQQHLSKIEMKAAAKRAYEYKMQTECPETAKVIAATYLEEP